MENKEYQLTCTASYESKQGKVFALYTTNAYLGGLIFSVSPSTGTAASTPFTLKVQKPTELDVFCEVGYVDASGVDVEFIVESTAVEWRGYTDSAQSHTTTLPQGPDTDQMLHLWAKCFEPTGEFTRLTQKV